MNKNNFQVFWKLFLILHILINIIHINIGDRMNNIDIREYIINNFKDDSIKEIEDSIDMSIESKSEDPLIGLGVLFELAWKNSSDELKNNILKSIRKSLN